MKKPVELPGSPEKMLVHEWFSLSYSNYLVLPRTLLQSMPEEWQARFIGCVQEFDEAFEHVERPAYYQVQAAREEEVSCLTKAQQLAQGVELFEPTEDEEDPDFDEDALPQYYLNGEEIPSDYRILVPIPEPIPAYNRGRTYIAPKSRT